MDGRLCSLNKSTYGGQYSVKFNQKLNHNNVLNKNNHEIIKIINTTSKIGGYSLRPSVSYKDCQKEIVMGIRVKLGLFYFRMFVWVHSAFSIINLKKKELDKYLLKTLQ